MAKRPENEINDPLNPYTANREIEKERNDITLNKDQKCILERLTVRVINMVSTTLIRMPYTFLLKLPGISLGAFRKTPMAMGMA